MQLWKMIYNPNFMTEWQQTWKYVSKNSGQKGLSACLPGAGIEKSMDLEPAHLMRQLCFHKVFVLDLTEWMVGTHFVL